MPQVYVSRICMLLPCIMMMSCHGKASSITGPLCGESSGHWWIPLTCDIIVICFQDLSEGPWAVHGDQLNGSRSTDCHWPDATIKSSSVIGHCFSHGYFSKQHENCLAWVSQIHVTAYHMNVIANQKWLASVTFSSACGGKSCLSLDPWKTWNELSSSGLFT